MAAFQSNPGLPCLLNDGKIDALYGAPIMFNNATFLDLETANPSPDFGISLPNRICLDRKQPHQSDPCPAHQPQADSFPRALQNDLLESMATTRLPGLRRACAYPPMSSHWGA